MQRHKIILSIIASLALSVFLLNRSNYFSESSTSSHLLDHDHRSRSLRISLPDFVDPKSIDHKIIITPPGEEAWFNDLKFTEPSIVRHRPDSATREVVVDVISIGCESKFDYMTAQADTWASDVRYFWGFTEREDFDTSCASMEEEMLTSYVQTCRSPKLGSKTFGRGHKMTEIGWFCAQRRPGRALGWLQAMYQGDAAPPDILILVDDDTSVDIDKVKNAVLHAKNKDIPFIGSGSVFSLGKYDGFLAPHGGFGTFFNKAAIQLMTQPIFCDERQNNNDFLRNACAKLQKNRAGELDSFRQGDSVLDIFFKHAAHRHFCMHSDWGIGYMVQNYSGSKLEQVLPQGKRHWCSQESVTCHNQTPKDMEEFIIAHPQME